MDASPDGTGEVTKASSERRGPQTVKLRKEMETKLWNDTEKIAQSWNDTEKIRQQMYEMTQRFVSILAKPKAKDFVPIPVAGGPNGTGQRGRRWTR